MFFNQQIKKFQNENIPTFQYFFQYSISCVIISKIIWIHIFFACTPLILESFCIIPELPASSRWMIIKQIATLWSTFYLIIWYPLKTINFSDLLNFIYFPSKRKLPIIFLNRQRNTLKLRKSKSTFNSSARNK